MNKVYYIYLKISIMPNTLRDILIFIKRLKIESLDLSKYFMNSNLDEDVVKVLNEVLDKKITPIELEIFLQKLLIILDNQVEIHLSQNDFTANNLPINQLNNNYFIFPSQFPSIYANYLPNYMPTFLQPAPQNLIYPNTSIKKHKKDKNKHKKDKSKSKSKHKSTNKHSKKDKKQKSSKKSPPKKFLTFPVNESLPFNGIFNFLTGQSNNQILTEIRITTSSSSSSDGIPQSVLLFTDRNKYFSSQNIKNSWICFEFLNRYLVPSGYSIRTATNVVSAHPRSWVIEVSNDGQKWETIDEEKNCQHLRGSQKTHTFNVKSPNGKEVRFVRMRLTDQNWQGDGNDCLVIESFELFGSLSVP